MLLLSFKTDKYIFRLEQLGFKWVLGPNQWFYYFKCNGYNCFPFVVNTELLHDMHIHKLFKKFTLWHIPEHTEHYMILPNHSADFLFFFFFEAFWDFFYNLVRMHEHDSHTAINYSIGSQIEVDLWHRHLSVITW